MILMHISITLASSTIKNIYIQENKGWKLVEPEVQRAKEVP
jgi:hypothetical protein